MPIMVDEIRTHQNTPLKYKSWCHLTITPGEDLEILHKFAVSVLGLRRDWFQSDSSAPHYDLVPSKRELALANGAVFVPAKEQANARIQAYRDKKAQEAVTPQRVELDEIDKE